MVALTGDLLVDYVWIACGWCCSSLILLVELFNFEVGVYYLWILCFGFVCLYYRFCRISLLTWLTLVFILCFNDCAC